MYTKLTRLIFPIFLESMMNTVMGSIDVIMLSSYHDTAVAAVSVANQVLFFIQVFAHIVTTGTSILCAQQIGAKESAEEKSALIQASVWMGLAVGFILTVLLSVSYPFILNFLDLSGQMRDFAGEYLTIIAKFLWVQMLSAIFSSILRAYGKTKHCMFVSLGINFMNILFNYLLIFGNLGFPELGIRGAAVATVTGRMFGLLTLGCILIRVRTDDGVGKILSHKKIQWNGIRRKMKQVVLYGVPAAGEQISYTFAQFVIMIIVTRIGVQAVTAQSYLNTCIQFIYIFSMSLGQGAAIMIGWNAGAKQYEETKRICRFAGKSTCLVSMIMMTGLYLFRYKVFSFFTLDQEILTLAQTVLAANFLLEIGRSQNLVYVNSLRAIGDVKFPFYMGVISMWILAVGCSYFLGIGLQWGLMGVWLAQGLDECARAVGMGIRWKKWRLS